MPSLTAQIDDQTITVDLTLVTALDATVYRQATGEPLDARIGVLIVTAPDDPADWSLADRGLLKWLFVRQAVNHDAAVAEVLASVTLFPPASDDAGVVDAPGVV